MFSLISKVPIGDKPPIAQITSAPRVHGLHVQEYKPKTSSWGSRIPVWMCDRRRIPSHLVPSSSPTPTRARLFSTSRIPCGPKQESSASADRLPHLTQQSTVHQISVSGKTPTFRRAIAIGHVVFSNDGPLRLIREHALKKGDALAVARVAGIMAVKKTSDIIPLAHGGVGVEHCVVDIDLVDAVNEARESKASVPGNKDDKIHVPTQAKLDMAKQLTLPIGVYGGIRIAVSVSTTAKTGVEMEALTGVMGAGLTVVDMCKAVDRHLRLESVEVVGKMGGKSGNWGVFANSDTLKSS